MIGQHEMVQIWCYAGFHCPFLITTTVSISSGIISICNGKKYLQCHYGIILQ